MTLSVCVLMGGWSGEREISLITGAGVLAACESLGYEAWSIDVCDATALNALLDRRPDICMIAMHGVAGEDGLVQAWLELHGIPYTGAGVAASAIAMDKSITKQLWRAAGLPVLDDVVLRDTSNVHFACQSIPYPLCVKPLSDGSSIGVNKVMHSGDLKPVVDAVLANYPAVMVEPWVDGSEFTVGILGDMALPVTRIDVAEGFYDFKAKYSQGLHQKVIPSGFGDAKNLLIKAQALQACEVLGVRHFARLDGLMKPNGDWVFLEVNTIPGLTPKSLVPFAAEHMGISYNTLIEKIITLAMASYSASHRSQCSRSEKPLAE